MSSDTILRLLENEPIVITGIGAVGCEARSAEALWAGALAGRSQASWVRLNTELPLKIPACSVSPADFRQIATAEFRKLDRCVQIGGAAAAEAWEQSGIRVNDADPSRIGVFVGTSRGPINKWAETSRLVDQKQFYPSLAAASTIACGSGALAQRFGVTGPAVTASAACASAAIAIIQGAQELALGNVDVALVGGMEAPLEPTVARCLIEAGVVARGVDPAAIYRPFSPDRNGLILGEGAGFLMLERAGHARGRKARVLAKLAGWSAGNDTAGRVGLTESGEFLSKVLERALARANLRPGALGWINAHGSGTQLNDLAESRAIFRSAMGDVPVSSTKPITGHCLGSTPAMEAVMAVQAIQSGKIPFTANTISVDPECRVRLVTEATEPLEETNVLSISCGFWGSQAALVFSAG